MRKEDMVPESQTRPLPKPLAGQPIQEGDYPKINTGRILPGPDLGESPFEVTLIVEGKEIMLAPGGSFRLIEIVIRDWHAGWEWLKEEKGGIGWWPVLCGMDIWIGRVPIIRTMIALNVIIWIALWMILR